MESGRDGHVALVNHNIDVADVEYPYHFSYQGVIKGVFATTSITCIRRVDWDTGVSG